MDELTILTRQERGIAELDNLEEIKAYLDQRLDAYRNLVYSEDGLKNAKADKAQLNKLKKVLDTRRKEIYMEPYLCIKTQIKELTVAAQEANAVNVLALLLEYKNAHFADFDPMDTIIHSVNLNRS